MNLKDYQGFIFDLDGTLLESMDLWSKIYKQVFTDEGMSMPRNYLLNINHMSLHDSAVYTVKNTSLPLTEKEITDKWSRLAKWQYAHNVELKEGAAELLEKLNNAGGLIGIATANPKGIFEQCLRRNRIDKYFLSSTSVDEVTRGKGEPDIYFAAARKLGLHPEDCVVFEDSHMGIQGAKKGGFATVGVYDRQSAQYAKEMQKICDIYVRSLTELL